jgi:hypothetical protein
MSGPGSHQKKLPLLSQFRWFLRFKSEFKGQIASKFGLGLLNAYKLMYFHGIEIRNIKFWEAIDESCVTLGEFHFSTFPGIDNRM